MTFPEGFVRGERLARRFGSLTFARREEPAAFWIIAEGVITPSLIREELPIVGRFGRTHSEGWNYIVDSTRVTFIHPFNPFLLRRVRSLPNNRGYIIIAPPVVRLFGMAVSWLIRPTAIVGSPDQALAVAREGLVSETGKQ